VTADASAMTSAPYAAATTSAQPATHVCRGDPVSQLPRVADAAGSGPVSIAQKDPVSALTRRKRGRPIRDP
jgi:hypothetical protein